MISTTPSALPQGSVRLSDWGLIRARGEDAASFLHGQLTQDMSQLQAGQARLAGYCSAKGRLLATFVVWRPADDEFLLACSADLLPAVLKRLTMFVLRAKCKLSDATAERALWGAAGSAVGELCAGADAAAAWTCIKGPAGDAIVLPAAVVDGLSIPRVLLARAPDAPLPQTLAPAAWQWLEARSGVARVMAATSEQFVPQMVNLELVGGVNFQKGCYPGQEVVARSQYRGTLKRRGLVVDSATALQPGQDIFHSADPGQPAGMVVLAGSLGEDRHAALVELKLAAMTGGSLHAGSADGPLLQLGELPYEIPAEAA
ncbi:Folate-dependent protein for Fe/S cluster synthesis/repair in oxidative stress [Rubrivivax sp. A210]|uniref:CAF17-like 4Fe-4S cluster assembly/insertion protein YgfZ n=1 Tax=Rubrivivax sp. A210 TaxID=2772301 RepID=UPI0019185978|nr:folate-binding protein YgfZ [Rubrivivax sp. A210]CAD5366200.1 Folate-dependent protein for Fe/S cluster synthesis/repair in oxidative stress [Rubrivivax sp. A210]